MIVYMEGLTEKVVHVVDSAEGLLDQSSSAIRLTEIALDEVLVSPERLHKCIVKRSHQETKKGQKCCVGYFPSGKRDKAGRKANILFYADADEIGDGFVENLRTLVPQLPGIGELTSELSAVISECWAQRRDETVSHVLKILAIVVVLVLAAIAFVLLFSK